MSEHEDAGIPENEKLTNNNEFYSSFNPDIDISGMDVESAYKYVLAFITELKDTQRKIRDFRNDLKLWENRIFVAEKNDKHDLAEIAKLEIDSINNKINSYESYEKELIQKVIILKKDLDNLKIESENSFDYDGLLSDLQAMAGGYDNTQKKFNDLHVESELEKLKKELDS